MEPMKTGSFIRNEREKKGLNLLRFPVLSNRKIWCLKQS